MSHPHPELDTPPELPKGGLRVTALGGLGEVGRNMTVLENVAFGLRVRPRATRPPRGEIERRAVCI